MSNQSCLTKQCRECESILWKWNQNVSTNSRTQTYTHIYTYTQTKYMASNVESRQLNKWHFLLCFFFSWYRHDQTWCSSSTLVWVDTMNIISFRTFFINYLHIDVRSTSGLKHYFHYYFKQYEERCVLLLQQLIQKNYTQNTFERLKCHCHLTSSPWFSFLSPAPARLHCMDSTQYAIVTLIVLFFISLQ